jgi:hypothetical protein
MEEFMQIIKGQLCPYCNCNTQLVKGHDVYPDWKDKLPRPKFLDKFYYVCSQNHDHYVGTYSDNVTALGRLANPELRKLKNEGHNSFDPLWKEGKFFNSQKEAYKWLSEKMNIAPEFTHFGMFTIEQCQEAIEHCKKLTDRQ